MTLTKIYLVCIALSFAASPVLAAPMGFKGSWMMMGDFGPNWQETQFNYALTSKDALGATVLTMRSDDEQRTRQLTEANYIRLLKRWNLPDAQANVWFSGGIGTMTGNDFSGAKTMATPGIQVDYETRRVYAAGFGRLFRAEGINHDYLGARLGFSFYETDYDELQPWFVLEARRMHGLSDSTEVTPMLRLIHKRYFVELGVNNARQGRVNFMYIF
jgi:hypothetical protein